MGYPGQDHGQAGEGFLLGFFIVGWSLFSKIIRGGRDFFFEKKEEDEDFLQYFEKQDSIFQDKRHF